MSFSPLVIYPLILALPLALLFLYTNRTPKLTPSIPAEDSSKPTKSIMQPPRTDLQPPKDTPFTNNQLKEFDGSDESKPIYVAIKGDIFDVTHKADSYGKGKSYNIFAGKDGSAGLGKSSLKPEDAIADYSSLDDKEKSVLDDWYIFFSKRYNIIGKVVDGPKIES